MLSLFATLSGAELCPRVAPPSRSGPAFSGLILDFLETNRDFRKGPSVRPVLLSRASTSPDS